jgi:hypothetical protein
MDELLKWWPVITTAAGLVAGGGAGKYALNVVLKRLDSLDKKFETTNGELNRLSTSVAVQSATLAAHTEQDRIQFHNLDDRLARIA